MEQWLEGTPAKVEIKKSATQKRRHGRVIYWGEWKAASFTDLKYKLVGVFYSSPMREKKYGGLFAKVLVKKDPVRHHSNT